MNQQRKQSDIYYYVRCTISNCYGNIKLNGFNGYNGYGNGNFTFKNYLITNGKTAKSLLDPIIRGDYSKDSINSFQVFTQQKNPYATQITTPYYLIKLGWLNEESETFITEDGQEIKTHGLFVKLNSDGLVTEEYNKDPKEIEPKAPKEIIPNDTNEPKEIIPNDTNEPNQEDNEKCEKGEEKFCNRLMSKLTRLKLWFKQSKKSGKKLEKKSGKKSGKKSVKKSVKKSGKKSVKKSGKKLGKKSVKKSMKKKAQKKPGKKSQKKKLII